MKFTQADISSSVRSDLSPREMQTVLEAIVGCEVVWEKGTTAANSLRQEPTVYRCQYEGDTLIDVTEEYDFFRGARYITAIHTSSNKLPFCPEPYSLKTAGGDW